MALTDEIFHKHLKTIKKPLNKRYNHYRPFDDPDRDHQNDLSDANLIEEHPNYNDKSNLSVINTANTNLTQIEHKNDTNITQTIQESITNKAQKVHQKHTNSTQIVHKSDPKSNTNIDTKGTQIVQKLNIHTIVGNQRKLLFYVYDLCRLQGNKVTPPLNIDLIQQTTGVEKGSIKTSLKRLIQKKFLIRAEVKSGRSGWVIFQLPDAIYQELFNNDIYLSLTQTRHKPNTESHTKYDTNTSIVSSSYINNTTTYIPEDFKKIDCSPLQDIGFDESHIIQIYREHNQKPNLSLSAEIIQNSINALAFDLKYNNAASSFKASPAVVLTAMLKKGQPYSSKTPEKVLSPREAAMQEYLLSQEQKNLKIIETETKAMEIAKKEWLNSLSEEELLDFNEGNNICPPDMHEKLYQISRRQNALSNAKKYFDNIIWPQKLKEILDNK